jgi:hypothetical protein
MGIRPAPLPSAVQPSLNGAPVTLNSPVNITDFGPAYGEFAAAAALFFKDGAAYAEGVTVGYGLLTGGATPDFAIGCFAVRCHAARVAAKVPAGAGNGAEDVWRLLMENGLDVAAVIARVAS